MCGFDSCLNEQFADDPNGLVPDEDDRRWRDLQRVIGHAAEKKSERKWGSYRCPPTSTKILMKINALAVEKQYPVTCGTSCETCEQGGRVEQGNRSYANAARWQLWEMGFALLVAEVDLCQESMDPLKYRAALTNEFLSHPGQGEERPVGLL